MIDRTNGERVDRCPSEYQHRAVESRFARFPRSIETRLPKSLWPFAGVILLYIVAIFIIPTGAGVGISDDWTYYLSVDNLVTHGRFDILSVSAATMVFQLFWGGLFGFIFGMSFGVLRMSTIVITLLGGLAVFGMARELGVRRERAALGMAVYLFNPILFAVTYSFMTDPHYLALLAMSSYFYLRGLRSGNEQTRYILYGAAVASLGVLQRPHARADSLRHRAVPGRDQTALV